MELEQKNAEIQMLRQQLVAMGSPPVRSKSKQGKTPGSSQSRQSHVDSVSPAKRSSRMRCWMCKVHPEEEIRFLSKDTYELLCRDCLLVGAHQGHAYCTIEDAAHDARRVLQAAMDQVLFKERDLTHAVKLMSKSMPSYERQQQFLLDSVAKEFGKIQAAVDLRRAEIEHAVLDSLRTASSQSTTRYSRLQQQQRALREACNRAHDALHGFSDMDLLSNAAEIESELEEASNFDNGSTHELEHQQHNPVPALDFNTDSLFDEISQFGTLEMQATAILDSEMSVEPGASPVQGALNSPTGMAEEHEDEEEPQDDSSNADFRTPIQRPKSASSTMRSGSGGRSSSTADTRNAQSQPRPSTASGRRRGSGYASRGSYAAKNAARSGRSPAASRFKWLTAPLTTSTSPMTALAQKRHFRDK